MAIIDENLEQDNDVQLILKISADAGQELLKIGLEVKFISFKSRKAGRYEKLLGFARSHSFVTRGSVSLSCATSSHSSCFSKY